ncbi:hypothetical protein [Cryptosporangium minutisporangium]|uniref:Uncharacterized protein n=1 Tax=Cryptosporangium minutisporangium TaxID=113569 RepID=A0ABP6TAQ3_9ACTN
MNTLWARRGLHHVRRALRVRTDATPPALRTLRFRRETVWVVSELASCSAAQRGRLHGGIGTLPSGWGDLAGTTAEPPQPGAVALLRRVDPPRAQRRRRASWTDTERLLGTELPTDYRELIDDRGPGIVADVVVYGPGGIDGNLDLVPWIQGIRRLVISLRTITCNHFPPPFHPEPGGILPWGLLHGRQIVGWAVTSDEPDTWPVVVMTTELDGLTLHRTTATGYLLARLPGPEIQPLTAG